MPLHFRNLTVSPDDPVAEWGVEGIVTAIERGGVGDWQKIVRTVAANPRGPVAADLDQAFAVADSRSSVAAIRLMLEQATTSPRESAVQRLRQAFLAMEYTQSEAARRLGTSAPRLSTYLSGKVMPSAEFLVKIERLAAQRIAELV